MELNSFQQQAFEHQRPTIEKFGRRAWTWTIFFLLWIIVGGYPLYLQIADGHIVTGMRDNMENWAWYVLEKQLMKQKNFIPEQ